MIPGGHDDNMAGEKPAVELDSEFEVTIVQIGAVSIMDLTHPLWPPDHPVMPGQEADANALSGRAARRAAPPGGRP